MPVDPAPSERGNICIVQGIGHVLAKDEIPKAKAGGERLWIAHFATCPNARKHRKAKEKTNAR